jgi:hypothetical protein
MMPRRRKPRPKPKVKQFQLKANQRFREVINGFHVNCLKRGSPSLRDYLKLVQATEKLFWGNEEAHTWGQVRYLIEDSLKGIARNR